MQHLACIKRAPARPYAARFAGPPAPRPGRRPQHVRGRRPRRRAPSRPFGGSKPPPALPCPIFCRSEPAGPPRPGPTNCGPPKQRLRPAGARPPRRTPVCAAAAAPRAGPRPPAPGPRLATRARCPLTLPAGPRQPCSPLRTAVRIICSNSSSPRLGPFGPQYELGRGPFSRPHAPRPLRPAGAGGRARFCTLIPLAPSGAAAAAPPAAGAQRARGRAAAAAAPGPLPGLSDWLDSPWRAKRRPETQSALGPRAPARRALLSTPGPRARPRAARAPSARARAGPRPAAHCSLPAAPNKTRPAGALATPSLSLENAAPAPPAGAAACTPLRAPGAPRPARPLGRRCLGASRAALPAAPRCGPRRLLAGALYNRPPPQPGARGAQAAACRAHASPRARRQARGPGLRPRSRKAASPAPHLAVRRPRRLPPVYAHPLSAHRTPLARIRRKRRGRRQRSAAPRLQLGQKHTCRIGAPRRNAHVPSLLCMLPVPRACPAPPRAAPAVIVCGRRGAAAPCTTPSRRPAAAPCARGRPAAAPPPAPPRGAAGGPAAGPPLARPAAARARPPCTPAPGLVRRRARAGGAAAAAGARARSGAPARYITCARTAPRSSAPGVSLIARSMAPPNC